MNTTFTRVANFQNSHSYVSLPTLPLHMKPGYLGFSTFWILWPFALCSSLREEKMLTLNHQLVWGTLIHKSFTFKVYCFLTASLDTPHYTYFCVIRSRFLQITSFHFSWLAFSRSGDSSSYF